MAGFLYFIPRNRQPTREYLAAIGFPFAACAAVPGAGTDQGPDGTAGAIFTLGPPEHPTGKEPVLGKGEKEWLPAYDEQVWLGWCKDDPPHPLDLQRRSTLAGHNMTLTDGHAWIVPTIRTMDGRPAVESVLTLGPDGQCRFDRPAPAYAGLWAMIHRIWQQAQGQLPPPTAEECFECVASAMALNYRVSKWELAALGVFTDANLLRVFGAIADIPILRDATV